MKITCIILFSVLLTANAESFKVSEHPAVLMRSITGFTEPSAHLDIEAEFLARVESFHVKEGETLNSSGQQILLVKQDSILAEIALKKEEAALQSEQQILKKQLSEKAIAEREVKYRLLEKNRLGKLSKTGKATQASFDMAEFEHDRACLKVSDIETSMIVQKQAINERKVAVAKAEEDLARHQIFGSRGWTVNKKYVEAGSLISPGEKIIQLVDVRTLSVYFRLSENEILALQTNEPDLRLKLNGKKIKAKIHHIDLNFDPVSRKRLVEMRIPGSEFKQATGGQALDLKLPIPYPNPAVKIPAKYIFTKLEQDYVKLSNGNSVALIPLRRNSDSVIINLSSLPKDAELILPEKN
ncbi:MAG: efflux RND transporter periplasmic adaptor subunit [Lentisphaerales bacterium]|nr:efflux RND transporter periplasmic adaptor subunit [Lentisphaerales bacterium]